MLGQEVMHQRCTTLDERGSSVADLFPSWERLSEEAKPGSPCSASACWTRCACLNIPNCGGTSYYSIGHPPCSSIVSSIFSMRVIVSAKPLQFSGSAEYPHMMS